MTATGRRGGPSESDRTDDLPLRRSAPGSAPGPSLVVYAASTIGGLALLAAVLAGTGMLAGPVCLAVVAGTLVLVNRRLCELADAARARTPAVPDHGASIGPAHDGRVGELESGSERPKAFWQSLSDDERGLLLALGRRRTFRKGSALFHKRDQADQVFVLLSGWTKICVSEGGTERVLAHRGPGQLIGERAALRTAVRSASAMALDDVVALVMSTADFASFIAEHPHVLAIVEDQIYERLIEPSEGGAAGESASRPACAGPSATPKAVERPRFEGQYCTVLLFDVAGFAAAIRTDEDRYFVRQSLFDVVQGAFVLAGLGDLDRCHWEDRGDGLLIIVPPTIPARTVLESLPPRLEVALQQHNRRSADPVRMKLRFAITVGPVASDPVGVSGESIIEAARILEIDAFKRALAASTACLGVIASASLYRGLIRHYVEALRAHEYKEIRSRVKESKVTAWMRLTGHLSPPDSP